MTQLEKFIKDIANTQYFAVLSTIDEGQNYFNLVSFAITTDLKSLIAALYIGLPYVPKLGHERSVTFEARRGKAKLAKELRC